MSQKVRAESRDRITSSPNSFPIVGVGASAGGLEAVTQLLKFLPGDTGMAFVLVQHLDPTHESALTVLLSRQTLMEVREAKNNLRLEPNHIYIIPPNKLMLLQKRRLKLSPRTDGRNDRTPVDYFFCSLAKEANGRTIGIILSGNGADGTLGLQAIKSAGGITFAQEEKSAKYPSMPGSAVAAGCVDFVLSPEKIAQELNHIAGDFKNATPKTEIKNHRPGEERAFDDILVLLRQRTAVDFAHYKYATLRRRIDRRLVLHKLHSLVEYRDFLRGHGGEIKELFNDILIHVTGFFRDADVFRMLKKKLFPRLLRSKKPEDPIRIWVPGCSTGEEVYSIAMILTEVMGGNKMHHTVQIFGTDINERGLEKARAAFYPENIESQISAERLRQFFTRINGGYRINKAIRELCIFARQNVTIDPPFSNLDLISCRNVLIYLGPALQRKVLPIFHYALHSAGLLMLGASETIGSFSDLFALADKKGKVYSKKAGQMRPAVSFSHLMPEVGNSGGESLPAAHEPISPAISDVQKQADRILVTNFGPASVVINKHFEALHFRGRTGLFLEHSQGEANLNLFKMAREGLLLDLRAVVAKAVKQSMRARQEGIRVQQNGHFIECSIEVIPFAVPPSQEKFYLVLFLPAKELPAETDDNKTQRIKKAHHRTSDLTELANLREELAATRESLQSIIQEQEATNEELRSANEEVLSSNEELQSTNEELQTAKEEMQSTNEELTTLNDELESRNSELEQVNNDLQNLLASVNIPVIILNSDLRIRRFTAIAGKMFKLIPGDAGRPITDIAIPLDIAVLEKEIVEVLETLAPKDLELQDKQGHWWSARIRAYKTTDHKIDGAVIALVNIDVIKTSMEGINQSRLFAEAIVNTVREPLLVLNEKLTVQSANQTFHHTFKTQAGETIGRHIYALGNGQWNIPRLRLLLEEVLKQNNNFNDFEVEHDFPHVGKKKLLLNARKLKLNRLDGQANEMILLAMEEK
jgi:two-component system CheB/CheR fusion protein